MLQKILYKLKPYLFAHPNPINGIISWIISWQTITIFLSMICHLIVQLMIQLINRINWIWMSKNIRLKFLLVPNGLSFIYMPYIYIYMCGPLTMEQPGACQNPTTACSLQVSVGFLGDLSLTGQTLQHIFFCPTFVKVWPYFGKRYWYTWQFSSPLRNSQMIFVIAHFKCNSWSRT